MFGVPSITFAGAIARYGLVLDVEGDRLTAPSLSALRARVQEELRKVRP